MMAPVCALEQRLIRDDGFGDGPGVDFGETMRRSVEVGADGSAGDEGRDQGGDRGEF